MEDDKMEKTSGLEIMIESSTDDRKNIKITLKSSGLGGTSGNPCYREKE